MNKKLYINIYYEKICRNIILKNSNNDEDLLSKLYKYLICII